MKVGDLVIHKHAKHGFPARPRLVVEISDRSLPDDNPNFWVTLEGRGDHWCSARDYEVISESR